MLLTVYAMYDRLDGSHRNPLVGRSDARVAKEFVDMLLNYKRQMAQKGQSIDVSDYELHKLGTFDDETGSLTGLAHYEVMPLTFPKETVLNDTAVSSAPQS